MINGIHHTSISTRDLDRLLAFYCDLLELEKISDSEWQQGSERMDNIVGMESTAARVAFVNAGNTFLELFQYSSPEPGTGDSQRRPCDPAITHICFDVKNAWEMYEKLSDAGVFFHSEPQRIAGVCTAYARDPDGNIVEFQEIVKPDNPLKLSPRLRA